MLHIRQLSYALGAEISEVDLREPLSDEGISEVRGAFLKHSLLLFRGQSITRAQQIAFSRQFGELDLGDTVAQFRDPKTPEILLVRIEPGASSYETLWHTDSSQTLEPPMASVLRSVQLPGIGGDTMFSNMYRAYEALSDGMKKILDGLDGVHEGTSDKREMEDSDPERIAARKKRNTLIAQPIVRTHPETGRKALYWTQKIRQIVGLTPEESRPLIDFLLDHTTRPQFCYRHSWQKDDILMWDNRCLMHIGLGDYDSTRVRHLERTTVRGTPSGYVYDGPLEGMYVRQ